MTDVDRENPGIPRGTVVFRGGGRKALVVTTGVQENRDPCLESRGQAFPLGKQWSRGWLCFLLGAGGRMKQEEAEDKEKFVGRRVEVPWDSILGLERKERAGACVRG